MHFSNPTNVVWSIVPGLVKIIPNIWNIIQMHINNENPKIMLHKYYNNNICKN